MPSIAPKKKKARKNDVKSDVLVTMRFCHSIHVSHAQVSEYPWEYEKEKMNPPTWQEKDTRVETIVPTVLKISSCLGLSFRVLIDGAQSCRAPG